MGEKLKVNELISIDLEFEFESYLLLLIALLTL